MVLASSLLFALVPLPVVPGGAPKAEEWLRLDRELESLSTSLASQDPAGVRIGGLIRTSFDLSGDDIYAPGAGQDLGGVHFQDVVVWLEGSVGDIDVRLSMDAASNTAWPPTDPTSAWATSSCRTPTAAGTSTRPSACTWASSSAPCG
jgi:hypothetical protein